MDFGFLQNYFAYPAEAIIFAVYIGISAAILITTYQKRVHGELVRRLLQTGTDAPENAKTLSELTLTSRFLRFALRRNAGSLAAVVHCSEQIGAKPILRRGKDTGKVQLPPVEERHYYLPPEKRDRALSQYGDRARWGLAVLAVVLFGAAALAAHFFADELATMASNFWQHYFG